MLFHKQIYRNVHTQNCMLFLDINYSCSHQACLDLLVTRVWLTLRQQDKSETTYSFWELSLNHVCIFIKFIIYILYIYIWCSLSARHKGFCLYGPPKHELIPGCRYYYYKPCFTDKTAEMQRVVSHDWELKSCVLCHSPCAVCVCVLAC